MNITSTLTGIILFVLGCALGAQLALILHCMVVVVHTRPRQWTIGEDEQRDLSFEDIGREAIEADERT